MRRWELLFLLVLIALGASVGNSEDRSFQLTWRISQSANGVGGFSIRLDGKQLLAPKSARILSDVELERICRALEDGGAWKIHPPQRKFPTSLYTRAWLRRGNRSREIRWDGIGSASQVRLLDALLRCPLGPEFRECIQLARAPLVEKTVSRVQAGLRKRRMPGCRQEILLESVPASRVIPLLEYLYPEVSFEELPTMNGFYLTGSRESILQIKDHIPNLDRLPFLPELSD